MIRLRARDIRGLLLVLMLLAAGSTAGAQAATGTLLEGSTLYPRVVRLNHGPASSNGHLIASTNGVIFESTDDGISWMRLGMVPATSGSKERCCATLYEMPRTVGSLAAGTLLSAGSYFYNGVPAIEIYTSSDAGRSWTYQGVPVKGGDAHHGVWEPEFEVANDGALVMFWSDETDPCCSQKLVQIRTYDGRSWASMTDTVATATEQDRPGMITVSKLPNQHYFMSYEVCGPNACTVYSRTSSDGWNYGQAASLGNKVTTSRGQYLEHAPANTWFPGNPSVPGALLLVGQVMYDADGKISASNGKALFVNARTDGTGAWSTVEAPVQVPDAYDNYCPNYSSALLPSADDASLLELASAYSREHVCLTYFGRGSWNSPIAAK